MLPDEKTIELEKRQQWVTENCVLLGLSGSKAYGIKSSNKLETRGVHFVPPDYLLGLNAFKEHNNVPIHSTRTLGKNKDVLSQTITRFINECSKGNIGFLELLFLEKEDYLKSTGIGMVLRNSRNIFITDTLLKQVLYFAQVQANLFLKNKGSLKTVERYGSDVKAASHAFRLYCVALQLLKEGTFTTRRTPEECAILNSIRSGAYTKDAVVKLIRNKSNLVKSQIDSGKQLPEFDFESANNLLTELNLTAIKSQIN